MSVLTTMFVGQVSEGGCVSLTVMLKLHVAVPQVLPLDHCSGEPIFRAVSTIHSW